MQPVDVRFSGSVPANYERYMVPLLFRPYAEQLASRAAALSPKRILETAAGTGVVTEALAAAVPDAEIIATDLNQDMLNIAAARISSDRISLAAADAQELPFGDGEFDLVVCQFGVMFYPDKVKGNSEAYRVLRDGGHYMLAIWDRIERNKLCDLANQSMHKLFLDNPPRFMERGPFSYHQAEWIERDLHAAGFGAVDIETVELRSRSPSADEAARGLTYGSPMGVELEDYGPGALDRVFKEFAAAAEAYQTTDGFDAPMAAHIVLATK